MALFFSLLYGMFFDFVRREKGFNANCSVIFKIEGVCILFYVVMYVCLLWGGSKHWPHQCVTSQQIIVARLEKCICRREGWQQLSFADCQKHKNCDSWSCFFTSIASGRIALSRDVSAQCSNNTLMMAASGLSVKSETNAASRDGSPFRRRCQYWTSVVTENNHSASWCYCRIVLTISPNVSNGLNSAYLVFPSTSLAFLFCTAHNLFLKIQCEI